MKKLLLFLTSMVIISSSLQANIHYDADQPCGNDDGSILASNGYRMVIINRTDEDISGTVYMVLADNDRNHVNFSIPKGDTWEMRSCSLGDRMSGTAKAGLDMAGDVAGETLGKAAEAPFVGEAVQYAFKAQGMYPVHFSALEIKYGKRKPKKYTYRFGLGGNRSFNLAVRSINKELQLREESDQVIWGWSQIEFL